MESRKFIKLFEEYTKINKFTWGDVRDIIQMKRPFMIIVFKNKSSYFDARSNYFNDLDHVYQTAVLHTDGKDIKYPSVFIAFDKDSDMTATIRRLFEKYEVKQLIYSGANSEFSNNYAQDGTSTSYGNEIVSATDPSEFSTENYFKLDSTVYRFIGVH